MDVLLEFVRSSIDLVLHMDVHLNSMIQMCGMWTYVLMFLVIFCETGLVITPFLPGDSLLFALGAMTSVNDAYLSLPVLFVSLAAAAILGNTSNYFIGRAVGPKVFNSKSSRFLNQKYLKKAQAFYEIYGGKTIVLSRFMPIVRTFAPFVAGIAKMNFTRYQTFNVVGGLTWVSVFLFAGSYFGNIPSVKEHFHYVILGILVVSVLPVVYEWVRERKTPPGGSI